MRLFYAIELSEEVRKVAVHTQEGLREAFGLRAARWTNPADMHITVFFLGEQSLEHMISFVEAGQRTATGISPFHLNIGGPGVFPNSGSPRVLWTGGTEPLDKPASGLLHSLRRHLPDVDADRRPYLPHVTLGYVRSGVSQVAVDRALTQLGKTGSSAMTVDHIVLMQTIPEGERRNSDGVRYNVVQVFPFQH